MAKTKAKDEAAKREAKRQAKLLKKGGAAVEESDDASPTEPERSEDLNESRSDGAIPWALWLPALLRAGHEPRRERARATQLLLVMTKRSGEQAEDGRLDTLLKELLVSGQMTQIELGPLDEMDTLALASGAATELVIDAPRFVALGTDNTKAAHINDLIMFFAPFFELLVFPGYFINIWT